jgi:hypothetical protein
MNVDSRYTTVGGLPAIRYLATVGKHVLSGVLVPAPMPGGAYAGAKLVAQPADAEELGPLDKTVDCASFCSDGSVAACCYGGVAVWRPRDDRSRRESDRAAPRKFSYKGWLVRLAPSPGNRSPSWALEQTPLPRPPVTPPLSHCFGQCHQHARAGATGC